MPVKTSACNLIDQPERLSLAQQNYVEAIAELCQRNGVARTSELADGMKVSMPSVSETVSRLVERGVAVRTERHEILLTARGRDIARQLARRHDVLKRFMVDVMALDVARADELACRIEHCVDGAFSDRLILLDDFLKNSPETLEAITAHIRRQVGARANEWSNFQI